MAADFAKITDKERQRLEDAQRKRHEQNGGRIPTYKRPQFASIPQLLLEFAQAHDFKAQAKRRTSTAHVSGFSLSDAREHLYQKVPGLYEYGLSDKSVHRLMVAPHKGRRAAKSHHAVVDCKVTKLRNDDREYTDLTHYGRANQKLLKEWHELYGQPRISGDDMNTLQVGRPIFSRYHRNRRFFRQGQGVNHTIHDFPSTEMNIKLGGFVVQACLVGRGLRRNSL